MKKLYVILGVVVSLCLGTTTTWAWSLNGYVRCDGNKNGNLDGQDLPILGAIVHVQNLAGTFSATGTSVDDGNYTVELQDFPDSYIATIDASSLPADAVIVIPAGGSLSFSVDDITPSQSQDWLVQSATCKPGQCWLTGGGTKYDNLTKTYLAEKGTKTTFGGNVHPGCSATAGSGGDWNNIDRLKNLHFHGTDIPTVVCGNIPNYPPGSQSPKTPFNYIEYQGTGWVKGIQGNKANYPLVFFFARAEDRNEPGSNGAKDGSNIDRYFLRVYTNPADPIGSTIILVDDDGINNANVDATPISTGNLQIHVSSCDNPPLQ
jgi:hypothetical protein